MNGIPPAAANGASAADRAATGGMPFMPFMPMGGGMGQQGKDGQERRTWLDEDEDVWTASVDALPPPVIGRRK